MVDSLAIIHKAIVFSVDSQAVNLVKNAISNDEPWCIVMLKDFVKNILPVLTGAAGSYFGIIFLNRQKKSENYFKSLETEISTHKEFRRELLLIDLNLKLKYTPALDSWADLQTAYMAMFKNNREHFQELRTKWIGLIDDEIEKCIGDFLVLIDDAAQRTAILESKFPEPTLAQSVEIDEYIASRYAEDLIAAKEKINSQTNLVIERIRKMMM